MFFLSVFKLRKVRKVRQKKPDFGEKQGVNILRNEPENFKIGEFTANTEVLYAF